MPAACASCGERHDERPAVEGDLAGVLGVGAGQDLDHRRLAGAVLADQRMHLGRRTSSEAPARAGMPAKLLSMPRMERSGGLRAHRGCCRRTAAGRRAESMTRTAPAPLSRLREVGRAPCRLSKNRSALITQGSIFSPLP